MRKNLKVVLFDPSSRGGICHYTFHLAESLAKEGVNTTLFTNQKNELMQLDRHFKATFLFKRSWFKALVQGFNWKTNPTHLAQSGLGKKRSLRRGKRSVPSSLRRWSRLLKGIWLLLLKKPDIVHFQWLLHRDQDYHFIRLLRFLGFRIFYTAHNVLPHRGPSPAAKESFQRIYHAVDRIIVHAESNKDELVDLFQIDPRKVVVIPHGSNDLFAPQAHCSKETARQELAIRKDKKVILFFGGIRKDKGLDILLDAFPVIQEEVEGAVLLVAGMGGGRDEDGRRYYANLRQRLHETSGVIFVEQYIPAEKVALYLSAADVVALPYRKTYQSGVLLAAYAAGRPVIVTDTGGLAEVAEHGRSGFVVAPQDTKALADAIITVLEDPNRAEEMGQYARYLGETKYSWKTAAVKTIDAYRSLIDPSRAFSTPRKELATSR